MTKTAWDIQQCPLAKRCRARWQKLKSKLESDLRRARSQA